MFYINKGAIEIPGIGDIVKEWDFQRDNNNTKKGINWGEGRVWQCVKKLLSKIVRIGLSAIVTCQ